jgi:hypothetical protein
MLAIPRAAVGAILEDVLAFGSKRVETGGFLLTPIGGGGTVTVLALAGEDGIRRRRGLFGVSGIALDRLFAFAEEEGLRVPAQFHSHGGRAFLSPTDLAHGLSVRGFVSCIVPFWNDPPADPRDWGWWRYDGEAWKPESSPEVAEDASMCVLHFDERGVW